MDFQKYNKALVPVGVLAVLTVLAQVGIKEDMSIKEALSFLVTAGLVYFIPNKK